MIVLVALVGCLWEVALIYILLILLQFSKKMGEVTRMAPYYRGLYVSILLLFVALITRFINASLLLSPEQLPFWLRYESSYLVLHHGTLSVGLTIALPIIWKYWGWLVRER